jgi:hypothetical protein
MGTKSRDRLYGTSVRAAEARRQADKLACDSWNGQMSRMGSKPEMRSGSIAMKLPRRKFLHLAASAGLLSAATQWLSEHVPFRQ